MFMDVGHKDPSFLFSGKSIRLVDAGTSVGGAVGMICNGTNIAVQIRIKMLASLAMIYAPRNYMPHVRNDTG